jgi:parallel beta-helix repeat protein
VRESRAWQSLLRVLCSLVVALWGLGPLAGPLPARSAGGFVVNSDADSLELDDYLTLREAIMSANGTLTGPFGAGERAQLGGCSFNDFGVISSGCGAGVPDAITFSPSITQVLLTSGLPPLAGPAGAGTSIEGNAGLPRVDASGVISPGHLLVIDAPDITVASLSIVNGAAGPGEGYAAIRIESHAVNAHIAGNFLGAPPEATGCSRDGVRRAAAFGVSVAANSQGGPGAGQAVAYIYGNTIGCHTRAGIASQADYVSIGLEPDGTTTAGNWIGISRGGLALPNGSRGLADSAGVWLNGAGRLTPVQFNQVASNVISRNRGDGIRLVRAGSNQLVGNLIGTDPAGEAAAANLGAGVHLLDGSNANTIAGNVISGNGSDGIRVEYSDAALVRDDKIGTDAAGTAAIPNRGAGLVISSTSQVTIDTVVVGGNGEAGIRLVEASHTVIGPSTAIGVAADGVTPLGNSGPGVVVDHSSDTRLSAASIAYNGEAGVVLQGGSANQVYPAAVWGNRGLPIEPGDGGGAPNIPYLPASPGPDRRPVPPAITSASGNIVHGTSCADCLVMVYQAIGNPALPGGGGRQASPGLWVPTDSGGHFTVTLPDGWRSGDITLIACQPGDACLSHQAGAATSAMSPRPVLFLPAILTR